MGKKTTKISSKCIGDGKLPNRYWVSENNDYYIQQNGQCNWYSESVKNFKFEGKTYPKAFKTFKEACSFADSLYNNSVSIEDRLSGELLHTVKIVCPNCLTEKWETFCDTKFTKEKMAKAGSIFE